jgi:hypothetical protein
MDADLSKLTQPTVRRAIEALQRGDQSDWRACFSAHPILTDDGAPRSFAVFTEDALGHERFTSIDAIENDGLHIWGNFHSDQWGDFRTFFKFQIAPDGKFERLDIGQAM